MRRLLFFASVLAASCSSIGFDPMATSFEVTELAPPPPGFSAGTDVETAPDNLGVTGRMWGSLCRLTLVGNFRQVATDITLRVDITRHSDAVCTEDIRGLEYHARVDDVRPGRYGLRVEHNDVNTNTIELVLDTIVDVP